MKETTAARWGLSGSTLKLLGCLFMLLDHIGHHLFPTVSWLRIVGRLAMPIFAYFIAEGCRYTRNKAKHFLLIFLSGMIFYVGAGWIGGEWYYNIFLTFSVSIVYIYLWQYLLCCITSREEGQGRRAALYLPLFLVALAAAYVLFFYMPLEYGFYTMLLPVVLSMTHLRPYVKAERLCRLDHPYVRLLLTGILLVLVSFSLDNPIQYFCLLALPLLFLYNGKPGVRRLEYVFYVFYPAHVGLILLVKLLFF